MPSPADTDLSVNYVFTNGMWSLKHGVSIDWALEAVKSEQRDNTLYTLATTRQIRNRGDTLNAPTVSTEFSTPNEGVIAAKFVHHKGKRNYQPRFELNTASSSKPNISVHENVSSFVSGSLTASVNTESGPNFEIQFNDDKGKLVTKLPYKSVGYVRDQRNGDYDTHTPFMTAQLHLSVGEKIYGLGERFGPFIKNGQSVEMWNKDGGTSSEQTYKNVPFYMSSRGYGIFIDHSENVNFEIQSERTTRVNVTVPGESLRIYIIHGPTPKQVLERYTKLTGMPALPPPWTFGLWLSTSFTTDYDINTVSKFLDGMKEREIPLSVFHFDCFWMKGFQWCDFQFDEKYFPDAKHTLSTLKSKYGIRVCVWINPYIAQESKLFDEGAENGYLIERENGDVWQTDMWQAGMAIVDFTNPEACKWFQSKLKRLLDIGVDAFKTDFGERIPAKNAKYHDGSDPYAMHNYYAFLYNKCVFDLLVKERGTHEACLFARSATAGGQQFPVHWGGDCESTFEAMAETVRGGLSLTTSGFGFWSHDIGGFEGNPDPAIYKRWVAFGLLSSHSRLHGSGSVRVPWNFDDESSTVLQRFSKMKCTLMPYLYSHSIHAHHTGTPLMRAMYVEFPEQHNSWTVDTQYMLGPNLLVAPVFDGDDGQVTYWVPRGRWYGLLDGKVRQGSEFVDEVHDYQSVPLLMRANSIVVTGDCDTHPDYDYADGVTVNIFDIDSQLQAKIPAFKKLGEYAGTVSVKKQGDDGSVTVTADGVKNWKVRVLGAKIGSVDGGHVLQMDDFGNSIVKATGATVTIKI